MKAEISKSDFTITLRSFCFFIISFKEIRQKLFQDCLTPRKNNVIQSFNFQLCQIIIDYLFKVAKLT